LTRSAIELAQAGIQLPQLVEEVKSGVEILITCEGQPVARLLPALDTSPFDRVPGSAKGLFKVPDDFDAPLEDFREHM
jgi:prevent-host-death family protein